MLFIKIWVVLVRLLISGLGMFPRNGGNGGPPPRPHYLPTGTPGGRVVRVNRRRAPSGPKTEPSGPSDAPELQRRLQDFVFRVSTTAGYSWVSPRPPPPGLVCHRLTDRSGSSGRSIPGGAVRPFSPLPGADRQPGQTNSGSPGNPNDLRGTYVRPGTPLHFRHPPPLVAIDTGPLRRLPNGLPWTLRRCFGIHPGLHPRYLSTANRIVLESRRTGTNR